MQEHPPHDEPLRFCIHSVTREQRRTLESMDAEGRDCMSACECCFRGPYVCSHREPLSAEAIANLLEHGTGHEPPTCQGT